MSRQEPNPIVKSATKARQGERGFSILALLTVSTLLAIIVLATVWFIFFKT